MLRKMDIHTQKNKVEHTSHHTQQLTQKRSQPKYMAKTIKLL
jgi:hypothetical protein